MKKKDLEKYSSAFTLSDMEIFIFPELLYSLVLANILSPEIWKWREDKWFRKIETMPPIKRIQRVKQYIMEHYNFNLDLETWGLTDKETEINRFRDFIDTDILKQSNALFGYEGDKYYFDIDIRRHFGLEKFDTDVIPYWKTETIEAMNAFRHKPSHPEGAGECVSLATLYAAALFIVARIPLEQIFLMGTPLHSQNFVMVDEGMLTNNRRIVTKSMWFNGSELSSLARRALEHEQVTIVTHHTGYIHSIYPEATINENDYRQFKESLTSFLNTDIDYEIFINFLRFFSRHQKLFQLSVPCRGSIKYLALEKAFGYEHGSKNRLGDKTAKKLLCEIGDEDFSPSPFDNRATISNTDFLFTKSSYAEFIKALLKLFPDLESQEALRNDLKRFVHTVPRLPEGEKVFEGAQGTGHRAQGAEHRAQGTGLRAQGAEQSTQGGGVMGISTDMTREEILDLLLRAEDRGPRDEGRRTRDEGRGKKDEVKGSVHPASGIRYPASGIQDPASRIQLAFYTGRFMDYCDWDPFLKAVMERNPVSVAYFRVMELPDVYNTLLEWPNESIYEGNRLALPDEVVNFGRGDGIEKALTLANIIKARDRGCKILLTIEKERVELKADGERFNFTSAKQFSKNLSL